MNVRRPGALLAGTWYLMLEPNVPKTGLRLIIALTNVHLLFATGDIYLRPPHVTVATAIEPCDPNGPTPAHKNWRHANWLNWVSVVNKQDYARLQGFDLMVTALQVRCT